VALPRLPNVTADQLGQILRTVGMTVRGLQKDGVLRYAPFGWYPGRRLI